MDSNNEKKSMDKIIDYIKHHTKQVGSVAIIVIIIVALAITAGKGKSTETVSKEEPKTEVVEQSNTESETEVVEESNEYELDKYPEINSLINNYYTYYASNDIDELKNIATPISSMEISYINVFSQYVELYQNIKCHTKKGMEEGSYVVSAELEIKFKDVETPAPGLDFFYIRKNEKGDLYIDNLYSQFNLSNQEMELDSSVVEFINDFETQDDVIALQNEVQTRFETAVESDSNLTYLTHSVLTAAISNWAAEAAEEAKKIEEEAAAAEAAAAEEAERQKAAEEAAAAYAEKLANAMPVYALDTVNVRASASTDAAVIGQLAKGSQTTMLEARSDGWVEIDYNAGTIGYVKLEYLSVDPTAVSETPAATTNTNQTANSNGFSEGTVITIKGSVNIRESMDSSSTKVATVFDGEKVTVIESYAEGWTKVKSGNVTGYIKTDLLKK